jgi:NitT/TauT family transport system substrate-binding protein
MMKAATNSLNVMKLPFAALSVLILLGLLLGACVPAAPTVPGGQAGQPAETITLRIAALPIIDFLPFYVAEKQGYFAQNNVQVSFIPAASAAERDQLIVAGQADGMINDMVSVALYNRENIQVQTVRFARVADKDTAMYRVLASAKSGFTTSSDLTEVPIGMSQGTVIDYVTARLLQKEGLTLDQIQSIAVPKLNERMALLESGELKAATLPEPFGSLAVQSGAIIIVDDSKYPEYGNSVISFRKTVIDQNPEAIRGFLAAIEQATQDINREPEAWRQLLGEYKMVPEPMQASYPMPAFPKASVPSEAQFQDVIEWANARKLIETDLSYSDSVTSSYLP